MCPWSKQTRSSWLFGLAALMVGAAPKAALAVDAHHSFDEIVSGNGFSVLGVTTEGGLAKMDAYLEHPYRFPSKGVQTRDLCYDAYFGVRVGDQGRWLSELPFDVAGYERATGIVSLSWTYAGLTLTAKMFSPFGADGPAAVLLLKVENTAGSPSEPVSVYFLGNFHLGSGAPDPDASGEHIHWNGRGYVEQGPSGLALVARPLPAPTHHACSPNNPYPVLASGGDLSDTDDSGTRDDAVFGFQWDLGALAPGETKWVSVALSHGQDPSQARSLLDSYIGDQGPKQLLEAARQDWEAWITPAPKELGEDEQAVYEQSEAILRMAQVREPGRSYGQILASLPPGQWNIAWVRDMCYAIVALAASGHPEEAWAAIQFMLNADSGHYQDYVGLPYKISVTRYYGSGAEESDSNQDGPNIEFDGFGLFLWALDEVQRAWPEAPWKDSWPVVRDQVANVLVGLMDPATGLIRADSSIWEVHWNGKQKHYAYTTLAAIKGLCAAADLAQAVGDSSSQDLYRQAAKRLGRAVMEHLVDENGVLAQSYEELLAGSGYHDAAVVEALNWGIVDGTGRVAQATLDALVANLRPASGKGFFRNDDGGWYDSQEWVFVDLRSSAAFRAAGRTIVADDLLSWITAQAQENYGLIAELHDAANADYEGEVPMAGFGAGSFILASEAKVGHRTPQPACGAYADQDWNGGEDAGPSESDAGPGADGGTSGGGGGGGCGCRSTAPGGLAFVLLALLLAYASRTQKLGGPEKRVERPALHRAWNSVGENAGGAAGRGRHETFDEENQERDRA